MSALFAFVLTAFTLIAWGPAVAQPISAEIYKNEAYFFSVPIPEAWRYCKIANEGTYKYSNYPDHGVTLTWGASPAPCFLPEVRPRIQIMAGYPDWMGFIEGVLYSNFGCNPRTNAVREAPPQLAFGNLPSVSCRIDRPNGNIEVLVAARKGEWRGRLCRSDVDAADYVARLQTRGETFEEDVARFRQVLATVRVSMPEQKFTCTRTYRNEEFGFSVQVPKRHPTCTGEAYQHDDGILIFLDRGAEGCVGIPSRPHINVDANYNAVEAPDVRAWLDGMGCDPKNGKVGAAPAGLTIGRHPAVACRVDRPDGWIDIKLAGASRWVDRKWDDWPYIIYSASLHTTPARLKHDLATFRQVLGSSRLFRPDNDVKRVERR